MRDPMAAVLEDATRTFGRIYVSANLAALGDYRAAAAASRPVAKRGGSDAHLRLGLACKSVLGAEKISLKRSDGLERLLPMVRAKISFNWAQCPFRVRWSCPVSVDGLKRSG